MNSNNEVFTRPVDGSGTWRKIPGLMKQITASGMYDVFAVDVNDKLFRCRKPCVGEWIQLDHTARIAQRDATVNAVFGTNSPNDIYRMDLPLYV